MPSPSSGDPGAEIQVAYQNLHQASIDLSHAMGVLDQITSHNDGLATEAELSGVEPDLVQAMTSFLGKWSYGLKCIKKDGDTLVTGLGAAADVFQHIDDQIANGLAPPGLPAQSGPPAPPKK